MSLFTLFPHFPPVVTGVCITGLLGYLSARSRVGDAKLCRRLREAAQMGEAIDLP